MSWPDGAFPSLPQIGDTGSGVGFGAGLSSGEGVGAGVPSGVGVGSAGVGDGVTFGSSGSKHASCSISSPTRLFHNH